jgi:hypothetical protein
MRRSRVVLTLWFVVVLVGCASPRWAKVGLTQEQFRLESYECERDARQSYHGGDAVIGLIVTKSFYEQCMQAKGYRKVGPNEVVPDAPSRSAQRTAAVGLSGTYTGEITGNSAGRILKMPVTLTLVQSEHQIVGTWTTPGGASGTLTGVLSENGVQLAGKQVNPCEGAFDGVAVVEAANTLRGSYVARDCSGSVTASFTVTRH